MKERTNIIVIISMETLPMKEFVDGMERPCPQPVMVVLQIILISLENNCNFSLLCCQLIPFALFSFLVYSLELHKTALQCTFITQLTIYFHNLIKTQCIHSVGLAQSASAAFAFRNFSEVIQRQVHIYERLTKDHNFQRRLNAEECRP